MLYNADDEKVPLTHEVEYLESYIDLQKIRFGEDVDIKFTRSGVFFGHGIEPMLLIPFVENAFKHGIGRIDNPAIFIELSEENGMLNFSVRNKFNAAAEEVHDKNSGIGLANVRKRLSLLYDDKYRLDINAGNEWFEVHLNLVLK
jgi:sensor histidine kinase YesM